MRLDEKRRTFQIGNAAIDVRRTIGGVVELWGEDDLDLARGLGWAHATDRLVQMMLVRIIGQGRISECLQSDASTLDVDMFMREMGFARNAAEDVANCSDRARAFGQAYCDGVNAYLQAHRRPLELVVVGYRPEPWRLEDILLTINVMSYVGLTQLQQDMEKLLLQAIAGGADLDRLKALFSPHLDGLDDRTVRSLREIHLWRPTLPTFDGYFGALPRFVASNNWAVAPARSASGTALQCNDPHLECNRLPAIWYELVAHVGDGYRLGATMPGVPGVVMGRTQDVSFGFTYGFMDTIDYFIEEVANGQVRRADGLAPLTRRDETIVRRNEAPVEITLWESHRGVIEAEPLRRDLPDGTYLARAWTGASGGAAESLDAICALLGARSTREAAQAVCRVAISCNWLLADRNGSIGYQQSGRLPVRRHSGLHPVLGRDPGLAWDGIVPGEELHARFDPPDGLLVTANDDWNDPDGPLSINLPMASYRAEQIRARLEAKEALTLDDMKSIQRDLYSLQAERFMDVLEPLLPQTAPGVVLREWDRCYDAESRGAPLFERVYHALLREVFGKNLFGYEAWDTLVETTNLLAAYYGLFDRVLLEGDCVWFGTERRDGLFRRVAAEVLGNHDLLSNWGDERKVMMENIFFAGKLPALFGFDHGPIVLKGGRASVVQSGLFQTHGRKSSFYPSWRFITDLGTDNAHTALAGGPSGRRFSSLYRTDIRRWLAGEYKKIMVDQHRLVIFGGSSTGPGHGPP